MTTKIKITRPIKGEKVKWKTWNVIVQKVKIRSKLVKIIHDYKSDNTMPYSYFWVEFHEIGY